MSHRPSGPPTLSIIYQLPFDSNTYLFESTRTRHAAFARLEISTCSSIRSMYIDKVIHYSPDEAVLALSSLYMIEEV
jgi:hypothetical protein